MTYVARPAIDRFIERASGRPDGCWLWTGAVNAHGYGTFNPAQGVKVYAHRWAYEHFVGPIPNGLELEPPVPRSRLCQPGAS